VTGSTESAFSLWHQRIPELNALARPLLQSRAVQRLASVTFLGILSPRFRDVIDSPLWPRELSDVVEDGSRYDHTLGVALVALDLARRFNFSERGQRYAVAWGLTHDIATWPLSHTSEPAFTTVTGMSARTLRGDILLGRGEVPEAYHLAPILGDLGLDPVALLSLFDRLPEPADEELALFKQVVRSPITPDTLEGMWRCGVVFGVPVMHPDEVVSALHHHRGMACLDRRSLSVVLDFWRSKSTIYERFINREDVIHWESAWAAALQRCCFGVTLAESLELSEDELVSAVKRMGLPTVSRVIRYKEPQEYIINGALDALPPEPHVSELWRVLRREPVGTSHE
jgi:HD domain